MGEEEAAHLRDMEAHPGDAHSALVFADWLEENGKPAHAEIIRLHHHPDVGGLDHQSFVDPGGTHSQFQKGLPRPKATIYNSGVALTYPKPSGRGVIQFAAHLPDPGQNSRLFKAIAE